MARLNNVEDTKGIMVTTKIPKGMSFHDLTIMLTATDTKIFSRRNKQQKRLSSYKEGMITKLMSTNTRQS